MRFKPNSVRRSLRQTLCWSWPVLGLATLAAAPAQFSQAPRDDFWVKSSFEQTPTPVLEANGLLYLNATTIAPPYRTTVSAFDRAGISEPRFPRVEGVVHVIVPDGRGGWFLGGEFVGAGGVQVANLVRVRPDFTVDAQWRPDPDRAVRALALTGSTLFVGGAFTRLGGGARQILGALDAETGQLKPWNPNPLRKPPQDQIDGVSALAVEGTTLYVGGTFTRIGGLTRDSLAALNTETALATRWNPRPGDGSGGQVRTILVEDDTVFVGGTFERIGGQSRKSLAALDTDAGLAKPWNASPERNGDFVVVADLAAACGTLYVAGSFNRMAGAARVGFAALDIRSGTLSPLQAPNVGENPRSVAVEGDTVFVGGDPTPGGRFLALDAKTGRKLWERAFPGFMEDIAVQGSLVVVAEDASNSASLPGRVSIDGLTALDPRTGEPTAFKSRTPGSPIFHFFINALTVLSNRLYVGATFNNVGQFGAANSRSAGALDLGSGALTAWNPNLPAILGTKRQSELTDVSVDAIAAAGDTVFIAAHGVRTNGSPTSAVMAFDWLTGALRWLQPVEPGDAQVRVLAVRGSALYAGGGFNRMGGQNRARLAVLDTQTGQLDPWAPSFSPSAAPGEISAATFHRERLFLGTSAGLFGFDLQTRQRLAWQPTLGGAPSNEPNQPVPGLVVYGDELVAGGAFTTVDGQPRGFLASFDAATLQLTDWNPGADQRVWWLRAGDRALHAGGWFKTIGGRYRPYIATFPLSASPDVLEAPVSQQRPVGGSATLTVQASGAEPLAYRWQFQGTPLSGSTNATLTLTNLTLADAGHYRAIVTNEVGYAASPEAEVVVFIPATITVQPVSRTLTAGATARFSVTATGTPPPRYQWRLNGVNLPGQVGSTLTIPNAQWADCGTYTVVVENAGTAVSSAAAELALDGSALDFADAFAQRPASVLNTGAFRGHNRGATREAGEPRPAGKTGGKSVWLGWRAPVDGIATFHTRGSAFDTLLAVYTNNAPGPVASVGTLGGVSADDDRGGFFTSEVVFNARTGVEYLVAVDGFGGASGNFVLSWNLDQTALEIPRIFQEPLPQTVGLGGTATFAVTAFSAASLSYQWLFNCLEIPGATNETLTVADAQFGQAGSYRVQVSNGSRVVESVPAFLEFGPGKETLTQDKFEDLFDPGEPRPGAQTQGVLPEGFTSVAAGGLATQVFSNFGALTELGEPNHAGMLGGASRWLRLRADTGGIMEVDTLGSELDTVLAVYTGTSLVDMQLVVEDNNGAADGFGARVEFAAVPGKDYLVAVDTLNGLPGFLQVSWRLIDPSPSVQLSGAWLNEGVFRVRLSNAPSHAYVLQASTNLVDWQAVLTNLPPNVTLDFLDRDARNHPHRFYRIVR